VAAPHLDPRLTERRNPRTADIDLASVREIVRLINAEDHTVAGAVAAQLETVSRAVEIAEAALRGGGRLIYAGAGTSGRLGVLDASECPPTFGTPPEMVQALIAGGAPAITRSQEGAEDRPENAARDVDELGIDERDFVVGIAASGTTPYVRAALARANARGARTAIVACSPPPDETLQSVDVAIVMQTGPEVLTGSTRMKAGTATKMVLNTITTGAMIRLGKTYGNLMVDLRATNAKLEDRGERIVMEVCDVDRDAARELIGRAGGLVKVAIVMQKLGLEARDAAAALQSAGGVIRRVISGSPPLPPARPPSSPRQA
jgi:N-acetylmuramic acid 6-phosphate etherase